MRDFIILHYCATQRDDSPFWKYCASMELPETLAHRIQMFRERAHVWQKDGELFRTDSWIQVMLYQGIWPEHYHHLTSAMPVADLTRFLEGTRTHHQPRRGADAHAPGIPGPLCACQRGDLGEGHDEVSVGGR